MIYITGGSLFTATMRLCYKASQFVGRLSFIEAARYLRSGLGVGAAVDDVRLCSNSVNGVLILGSLELSLWGICTVVVWALFSESRVKVLVQSVFISGCSEVSVGFNNLLDQSNQRGQGCALEDAVEWGTYSQPSDGAVVVALPLASVDTELDRTITMSDFDVRGEHLHRAHIALNSEFEAPQSPKQAPPSPDYVPGPEHPPSPDYVPGLEYPEYVAPSDDEIPVEDQPLLADASPTALSSGYVADFDPSEDPKEDPEEDPADYPTDGGDDDEEEEESSEDDDDDDEEDKDEEGEHLALADSSAATPTTPPNHTF
ncbi:hypothetical protein Tco_0655579 [Tanacetum coccineum]|uniref:Uncharacterized protein n=1 Tax=Tanacetum coccineum TaxID=301880 RepID=A0ABQ4X6E4_9ASTR